MDIESVRLKTTLKARGKVYMAGEVFHTPFPAFIKEEISAGARTIEVLKRTGDPAPAVSKAPTPEQIRLSSLQEAQRAAQAELGQLQVSSSEKENALLEEINTLQEKLSKIEGERNILFSENEDLKAGKVFLQEENDSLKKQVEKLEVNVNSKPAKNLIRKKVA